MRSYKPLLAAVLAMPLMAAVDSPAPADGHDFTVLYLNNRLGELNPCG